MPDSKQGNLFNRATATQVTEDAIKRVEKNAKVEFLKKAGKAVRFVARRYKSFTMDDVHHIFIKYKVTPPREPRAWGAVVKQAKMDRVIEDSGRYIKSERVACHRRPIPVYRSLIFDGRR